MNTARKRGLQGTCPRSGRELQAEKRTALAAVDTGANAHKLESLVSDTLELRELAFVLRDAQNRFTRLRRQLRSKVYPIPEYAEFANHILDLFAAVPDIPVSRALGPSYSGLRGLENIKLARGISTEVTTENHIGREVCEADDDLAAKMCSRLRSMKQMFDEDDDEAGVVGQPVGPTPREVERALHSIQIATEQQVNDEQAAGNPNAR